MFICILKYNSKTGIIIVSITKTRSVLIAVFSNLYPFLFTTIVTKYCIKFIMLELKILNILTFDNPLKLETLIVRSSGVDVDIPDIFPTVLAFKFKLSASFLNTSTRIYFEISTINPE